MRRMLLIGVLALGVVGGYGSAIAQVAYGGRCGRAAWSHPERHWQGRRYEPSPADAPERAVDKEKPAEKAAPPTIIHVQPPAQPPVYVVPAPAAPARAPSATEKP